MMIEYHIQNSVIALPSVNKLQNVRRVLDIRDTKSHLRETKTDINAPTTPPLRGARSIRRLMVTLISSET